MAYILHIETATKNCSVALAKDGVLLAKIEENSGSFSHAERLHPIIDTLLKDNAIEPSALNAIAVGKGPGSYTGLRIGVSAAKGLCYALGIPLIAMDSLEILAQEGLGKAEYIIPMLDARRMEVYTAVYDKKGNCVETTHAKILDENSFSKYCADAQTLFLGDGVEKTKALIGANKATFVEGKLPSAKDMVGLAFQKYQEKDFEDVAYFEPYYLKDFVVTKSKKKL